MTAYGATAIPATFLIGPDGRIIARDLRGNRAKEAVAKALESVKSSARGGRLRGLQLTVFLTACQNRRSLYARPRSGASRNPHICGSSLW